MEKLTRREFLGFAPLWLASGNVGLSLPGASSEVVYGFTQSPTPARRLADATVSPYATFPKGALLRLYNSENNGFTQIVRDSWVKFPNWLLAFGTGFVPLTQLQLLRAEMVAPVHPDVAPDQKRIHISLADQEIFAFENKRLVNRSKVSTGLVYPTPVGEFYIYQKRWARQMQGFNPNGTHWDLPGVPFVMYFDPETGDAIHGTYWHHNFGHPMSHGCVNLPTDVAQWFYRWTTPTPADFDTQTQWGKGTRVTIA